VRASCPLFYDLSPIYPAILPALRFFTRPMPTDAIIKACLAEHAFQGLFIEELGWDQAPGELPISLDGRVYCFKSIAEKRGLRVLVCAIDRHDIKNRTLLQRLQKALAKAVHEHIAIYETEGPKRQVWQWVVDAHGTGTRTTHREHPFISDNSPPALRTRLPSLAFSLDEENEICLAEAARRVRVVLGPKADNDMFVHKPAYAKIGDQLAREMRAGGVPEFHRFILFHQKLVKIGKRGASKLLEIDEEDLLAACFLPLIRAAKKFNPELGFEFSTYACGAILKDVYRHRDRWSSLPFQTFPGVRQVRAIERMAARFAVRFGESARHRVRDRAIRADYQINQCPSPLERTSGAEQLDVPATWRKAAVTPDEHQEEPIAPLYKHELPGIASDLLSVLDPRLATVITMRFGLNDQPPVTLEVVGRTLGVTKERVRQMELTALTIMRPTAEVLCGIAQDDWEVRPPSVARQRPFAGSPDVAIPARSALECVRQRLSIATSRRSTIPAGALAFLTRDLTKTEKFGYRAQRDPPPKAFAWD